MQYCNSEKLLVQYCNTATLFVQYCNIKCVILQYCKTFRFLLGMSDQSMDEGKKKAAFDGSHSFLLLLRGMSDQRMESKGKQGQPLWAAMNFYCHREGCLIREWKPRVNKGSLCGQP